MMNFDAKKRAREKVEVITAKLDHSLIMSQFDRPIDDAARQFTHATSFPITHRTFHKVIAEFVVQIYDKGLKARWMASGEPLSQAIDLLEKHYNSVYGRGYIAAALDANDAEEGGIEVVLNRLAEIIKEIERLKHIQAVFIVNIDPIDWHLKCEIVRILFENYKPFLPKHLLQCKPWELANEIPSIMYRYICSDTTLQQILSFPEKPLTVENLFTL
ncbi:MAG: hypothetical protein GY845_30000 [Planctomycetes bacterium]|nr:hypothetical protein [Planctomycetota bacterium]